MESNIQHMILGIGTGLAVLVPVLTIWAQTRFRKQTRKTIRDYRNSIAK